MHLNISDNIELFIMYVHYRPLKSFFFREINLNLISLVLQKISVSSNAVLF